MHISYILVQGTKRLEKTDTNCKFARWDERDGKWDESFYLFPHQSRHGYVRQARYRKGKMHKKHV